MFRQILCLSISTVVVLNFASLGLAVPIESVPNPRHTYGGWVTDMASMITLETEEKLNSQISALEVSNGSEIAVVTVPDIAPFKDSKAFATQLFDTWGIGKRGRDNGILFLVSKRDRKIEIIRGKGFATLLPNSRLSGILQQDVTPKFKQGQFDAGILAGTQSLITRISQNTLSNTNQEPAASPQIVPQPSESLELTTPSNPTSLNPNQSFQDATIGSNSIETAPLPAPETTTPHNSTNPISFVLAGLGVVTVVGGVFLYRRSRRVFLEPEGDSQVEKSAINGRDRFHCATCKRRMEELTAEELSLFLTEPQQMAQQLGSVAYTGWRCMPCQPSLYGRGFHIRASILNSEQFSHCSTCDALTGVTQAKVIEEPTWNQEGKRLVNHTCQCCSKKWQTEEPISRLPLPKDAATILPVGRSRVTNSRFFQKPELERPTHCLTCHYPMEQIRSEQLAPHLRQAEQIAQELGSVWFVGWHCSNCYPEANSTQIHVRAYVLDSHYHSCPTCQELTVEQVSSVVRQPTSYQEGERRIVKSCYCCGLVEESRELIPRLPSSSVTSSSSTSSSSTWNFSSTSSSSDSGSSSSYSSSSSSDFGGGSSDSGSSSSYSSSSSDYSSSSSSDFGGGSSDSGSSSSW